MVGLFIQKPFFTMWHVL